jgi:hypothetical protein
MSKTSIFVMLSLACVSVESIGLPSVKMSDGRGEVQYFGLN